jgi:2-polyprenyl-6-methoxyphenol hydroxylase-like FAD-dependent oxidoreductase
MAREDDGRDPSKGAALVTTTTPVLIVGAGHTGLALAIDLQTRGIPSVILAGPNASSRPVDRLGPRAMEIMRRWGVASEIRSAGHNRHYTQDTAWPTSLHGLEFGRERIPALADEHDGLHSPQGGERLPSTLSEAVLRRVAETSAHVEIRDGAQLLAFEDRGDAVLARIRGGDGGDTTLVASYLVAADEGDAVREALGIDLIRSDDLEHSAQIRFHDDGLDQVHTTRPARRYDFIGPEGAWAVLEMLNGRDEWRFTLLGAASIDADAHDLTAALHRALGVTRPVTPSSITNDDETSAVARAFGHGRVFLAGDAAHRTPAAGGLERNGGLIDAANLSWKLAALFQGWGGEALLDSYDLEQRPLAERDAAEAVENRRRMRDATLTRPDPVLFDFADISRPAMDARRAYGEAYTEAAAHLWHTQGAHLGHSYSASPLVVPDGAVATPSSGSEYHPTAAPGSRAPHVWLDAARTTSILDVLGPGFTVLSFDAAADPGPLLASATESGIPLLRVDVDAASAAALYERPLVLVRPDGHVAWRGDAVGDPAALLRRVTGRD